MIYPIEPLYSTRNNPLKLGTYEIHSHLLQKRIPSTLIKLPSLSKERESQCSQKNISDSEGYKSILMKSVSLDLSEEVRKKNGKSKSKLQKDAFEDAKSQKNKFDHYKKYIECMSNENINNHAKISSLVQFQTLEPRKTQMPYIRAEKKEFHRKHSPNKYDNIVCDQAFVRIKSPGSIRIKVQTSRALHSQSKIYSTIQQQLIHSPLKKQQSPIRKLSHSPIKAKRKKILLEIMKAQQTQTNLFFTPWQSPPATPYDSDTEL